jgi:hypothetical protein
MQRFAQFSNGKSCDPKCGFSSSSTVWYALLHSHTNTALSTAQHGGGVYIKGPESRLTVVDSLFIGNKALLLEDDDDYPASLVRLQRDSSRSFYASGATYLLSNV